MAKKTTTRRSRVWRRLAIVLVVVLVLLLLADRIGDYAAERAAATTVQNSQHLDSRPDVDVAGFPFLTQLVAGDFDDITVTAKDVRVGQQAHQLNISRVRAAFHDVSVSRDFQTIRADHATAQAVIDYGDLSDTVGIDLRYAGNHRVSASKEFTIAGQTVTPTVTVQPQLVDGALSFTKPTINGVSDVTGEITRTLNQTFDLSVPLQGLPFQVRVTGLSVDESGLHLRLAGTNLVYRR